MVLFSDTKKKSLNYLIFFENLFSDRVACMYNSSGSTGSCLSLRLLFPTHRRSLLFCFFAGKASFVHPTDVCRDALALIRFPSPTAFMINYGRRRSFASSVVLFCLEVCCHFYCGLHWFCVSSAASSCLDRSVARTFTICSKPIVHFVCSS